LGGDEAGRVLPASGGGPRASPYVAAFAGAFLEEYKRLRQKYERVYSVHLSGKLSGTCRQRGGGPQPDRRVKVVDSLLATGGIALLVDRMLERIDRGTPEDELDAYIERFPEGEGLFLPTHDSRSVHKGGASGGGASHGDAPHIKPVLTIDDGVIEVYKKVRGLRQALEAMRDGVLEKTELGRPSTRASRTG